MNALHPLRAATALLLLGTVGATVAQAQQMPADDEVQDQWRWEVTPFIGYRGGGGFDVVGSDSDADLESDGSFGLAVDLESMRSPAMSCSIRVRRRASSPQPWSRLSISTVEYLHLGGTLLVSEELPFSRTSRAGLALRASTLTPAMAAMTCDSRFRWAAA